MTAYNPRTFLEEHPRMIGVSFFLLVLLLQAEPVLAGACVVNPGP